MARFDIRSGFYRFKFWHWRALLWWKESAPSGVGWARCVHVYICMYVCVYVDICVYVYLCISEGVDEYACMFACTYVHVYV